MYNIEGWVIRGEETSGIEGAGLGIDGGTVLSRKYEI